MTATTTTATRTIPEPQCPAWCVEGPEHAAEAAHSTSSWYAHRSRDLCTLDEVEVEAVRFQSFDGSPDDDFVDIHGFKGEDMALDRVRPVNAAVTEAVALLDGEVVAQ